MKLIDIVYAYTPFANGGLQVGVPVEDPKPNQREFAPAVILKIVDAEGRVIEEYSPGPGKRVITPQVAWMVSDILSDDEARSDTYGRNSPLSINRPAAAKTGTTDNYEDSWTIGYSPDLVVGTWVGNANNQPMRQVLGVSGAGAVWHGVMQAGLKNVAPRPFVRPPGLVQIAIDPTTGLRPSPGGPSKMEWFPESAVPTRWTQAQVVPTNTPPLVPVKPAPPTPTPAAATPTPASASTAPPPPTDPPPTATLAPPRPGANEQPSGVIVIPNLVGLPEADARRVIQSAGLGNTYTNYQTANDVADKAFFNRTLPGRVLSQTPPPGGNAARGTIIYLVVRKG